MRGLCVVSGMFCVPPRVFVSVVRSKRSESLCLPKVANVRLHCDSFRRLSDMSYGMSIQIARTPKDPRAKMQIQKYFLGFSPCELTADGPRSAYFGVSARGWMDKGGKWKGCRSHGGVWGWFALASRLKSLAPLKPRVSVRANIFPTSLFHRHSCR